MSDGRARAVLSTVLKNGQGPPPSMWVNGIRNLLADPQDPSCRTRSRSTCLSGPRSLFVKGGDQWRWCAKGRHPPPPLTSLMILMFPGAAGASNRDHRHLHPAGGLVVRR